MVSEDNLTDVLKAKNEFQAHQFTSFFLQKKQFHNYTHIFITINKRL